MSVQWFIELFSIIDDGSPQIDSVMFPLSTGRYLSASSYFENSAFGVGFHDGGVYDNRKLFDTNYIRCVADVP